MSNCLLSVVIPAHNAAHWLPATIQSLEATFCGVCDFEAIVVDDGSTDETLAVTASLKTEATNLVIISSLNQGAAHARNLGSQAARGEWLYFLDADDLLNNSIGPFIVDALAQSPKSCNWIAFRFKKFSDGKAIPIISGEGSGFRELRFYDLNPLNFPICVGSQFVRRQAFVDLNGFPEGEKIGEDIHFWGMLGDKFKLRLYDKTLLFYRQRESNNLPVRESQYKQIFPLIRSKLTSQLFANELRFLFRYAILNIFVLKNSDAEIKTFYCLIKLFSRRSFVLATGLSIISLLPFQLFNFVRSVRRRMRKSYEE